MDAGSLDSTPRCGQKVTAKAGSVGTVPDTKGAAADGASSGNDRDGQRRPARFRLLLRELAAGKPQAGQSPRSRERLDRVRVVQRGAPDSGWPREHRYVRRTRVPRPAGVQGILAPLVRARDWALADLVGVGHPVAAGPPRRGRA